VTGPSSHLWRRYVTGAAQVKEAEASAGPTRYEGDGFAEYDPPVSRSVSPCQGRMLPNRSSA
jgi:hypothetical protein